MLTAALVRLDTAWSARPQLRRPASWRGRCQIAREDRWVPATARPGESGLACSAPESSSATTAGGAARRAASVDRPSAALLLRDLGARRRERAVGLPAQHLVDEPGGEQLADPPQPDETRRHEIVVGEAVFGVRARQLVDALAHAPAEPQIGESLVQLGEVNAVVAQVRPGAVGE